ncbi:nuclear pore complex protein Nup85-like [Dendronephthya gigantea]|uniref:nuclear pore complex protein Nup85-like n=1 Tax=Dendronephthya gigantea TaxID=151771 RepID=UPI00106AD068|nr:nuclear pore complex protein Nup85-like [Dendronephthya gigantea]XP_028402605.1 nuclear pore complex protein Nup85-like [Dendronephthya gigantea]
MEQSGDAVMLTTLPLQGRLQASWGGGNSLWVYSGHDSLNGSSRDSFLSTTIHQMKMEADLQNKTTRRLINETHGIFLDLQQLDKASAQSKKASLVTFSRRYRAVLRACLLTYKTDENADDEYNQVKLLSFIELVWHLCEILLIENLPGGIVLQHLLDWVKWHCDTADRLAREVADLPEPAESSDYWPAIYHLLFQGRIKEARDLLTQHPDRNPDGQDQFAIVDDLLKRMPSFKSFIGQAEFAMKWNYWKQECQNRCSHGELSSYPQLLLIAQILCGDNEAFVEVKDVCQDLSWYEIMVAKLLYSNPTIKSYELQYHTKSCIDLCGGQGSLQMWHQILLAAMEFDVHSVIKLSSECFGNWWFVAHLVDLFHHCDQLESHQTLDVYQVDLREFLILEYASSLMSHQSLWQVAADYFLNCPARGRHYLEEYIDQIPLENEFKAFKVLNLCQKLNFPTQALSICKQMGMRAYQNNKLGSALSWCIKAKDPTFASFISERFTDEYFNSGEFSSLDLIDNLGSSMLLCDRLTFLGKYREFHLMYENGEFIEAGNLLISLLTSNLAPKRIWLSLLTDALPLLEHEKVIFTSEQTYELMRCLEDLRLSFKSDEYLGKTDKSAEDKENIDTVLNTKVEEQDKNGLFQPIRLALSRNLSRALLIHG